MRILITGAAGFIGRQLVNAIATEQPDWHVLAADLTAPKSQHRVQGIALDVSQAEAVHGAVKAYAPDAIVHLASVVTPPPGMSEARLHAIDVGGTQHLLDAAVAHHVKQFIVTSSGAAYGYSADNAEWLDEHAPLRGHAQFAYAKHKREVEDLLADYRAQHPALKQLILRPGTVLGRHVNNQITDLFKKPVVMGIHGSDSRFVFIWDEDVVNILLQGLREQSSGIFNLAGDGALSLRDIAQLLRKPYLPVPAILVQGLLALLKPLRLSQYGPEQVDFLRYRPVLANQQLKQAFAYTPRYSSREAFLAFLDAQGVAHA
ncbi:NAD-dependent epimerase/dehydratase family protein [Atopomonas sediminilitoris]|uniref:NAD-dependent epimerase/dehydratase family protein n=1 Tax=Atopomonas sediminilitoris TaxID=2919919 RepID=UPI001F4E9BC9|nr:NAD-dependent epimerase/dehydratase family protein [Atopomonas sediminilitoris]MCJ8169871.1 NAD-dependent epimerase/dehydratase family protein [Atopomonas sediminilitoris]